MSEIINETINELNKPTQNNVFSIGDNPVTVLEKINQVERYLKQIDTSVDTSINTANEALEKANNAFEANGTLVKINGENQLTWSADFAESERQKTKNLFNALNVKMQTGLSYNENTNTFTYTVNEPMSSGITAFVVIPLGYLDAGTYTVSFQSTSSVVDNENGYTEYIIGKLNQQGDYESLIVTSDQLAGYNTITFTISERLYVGINWYYKRGWIEGDTPAGTKTLTNIQLETGSVATNWQPYNGAIVHEKKLNEIVNGKYPIDINACTTYDQVFNQLQNATYGQCGIGVNHTNAIKSLLPTFPTNAFYVDCVANVIKNKYTASPNLYAIRFTGYPFGSNQPIYYCDVFYDGENTIVTGWYKPETVELIYDIDTKNTLGGTAYRVGIPFSNISISNVDFNKYKYLRFTCRWNTHLDNWFGGAITFDLDLTTPYNSDAEYMSVISNRPSSCYVADDALTYDLVGQITVNGSKNSLGVNGYKITYTGQRTAYTSDNYLTYFRIEKIEGIK